MKVLYIAVALMVFLWLGNRVKYQKAKKSGFKGGFHKWVGEVSNNHLTMFVVTLIDVLAVYLSVILFGYMVGELAIKLIIK